MLLNQTPCGLLCLLALILGVRLDAFSITPPLPPANDDCAGALSLTVNPDLNCGTVLQTTTAGGTPSGNNTAGCFASPSPDDDVWFSFVAGAASHRIKITAPTQAMVLQAYSGDCTALTNIVCNNPIFNVIEQQLNGLIVGQTYYLRVFTYQDLVYEDFTICVGTPPPAPANDGCAGALLLTVNPDLNCGTVLQTTTAGGTPSGNNTAGCFASPSPDDDVWFSFVAGAASHRIKITAPTQAMVLQAYSGDCTALTNIVCNNPIFNVIEQQLNGLIVGQTYYLRVFTYQDLVYEDFTICVGTPPPAPANDVCAGALSLTVNADLNCVAFTNATTFGGTPSVPEVAGCCCSPDDDVWFTFVATGPSHLVKITGATPWMVMQAFSGVCGNLSSLVCEAPSANNISYQLNGLISGQTVYLRVYTSNNLQNSNFTICISTPVPAPPNDHCSGAIALTVNANLNCGTVLNSSTAGGTQSLNGCSGTADDDVWFQFVATGATHRVKITGGTGWMVLQSFSGSCSNLTSLACTNGYGGAAEHQLSGLTAGQTYWVRVYTGGTLVSSNFSICVGTPSPPPANDNCPASVLLVVSPNSNCTTGLNGTTVGATRSMADCSGTADDDVWYRFVATAAAHTITVTAAGGQAALSDLAFQLFSGNCTTLTSIRCENSQWGQTTETWQAQGLTPGQTYYIRVFGASGNLDTWGQFNICVTKPTVPVNNECAGALVLAVSGTADCSSPAQGTTADATRSANVQCGGGADVWYQFTATGSAHAVRVTPTGTAGAIKNPGFELYSGSCAGPVSLACVNDYTGQNTETRIFKQISPGAVYLLRVYNHSAASGDRGSFEVCVTTPEIPANDDCAGAIRIPVGAGGACQALIAGTTKDATASGDPASCKGSADDDVWFKFTATYDAHTIQVAPAGPAAADLNNPVFEVFAGACGALTRLDCVNDYWNQTAESAIVTGLTAGQEYYVRVYSEGSGVANSGAFEVCVFSAFNLVLDLAVEAVELPQTGCNQQANETVRVRIRNLGNTDRSGVDVAFSADGASQLVENTGGLLIPALGSAVYTFTARADLSAPGAHTIKVYPSTPADNNRVNDTLQVNIENLAGLATPGGLLPADATMNQDLPVSLSWSAVPNASQYELFIWPAGNQAPVTPSAVTSATSRVLGRPELDFGIDYRWRVAAKAPGCAAASSPTQGFFTKLKPDLAPGGLSATANPVSGQTIGVQFNVTNLGPGATGRYTWRDVVILASEPDLLTAGVLITLNVTGNTTALDSGATYQKNLNVTLPAAIFGNYYLIVLSDRWMEVEEVNNNNNMVVLPLTIQPAPSPDLQPQSVQYSPATAFSEDTITVSYSTLNAGDAPLNAARTDRVYLSSDQTFSPATDYLLGSFTNNTPLLVGQGATSTRTVALPVGISGNWYVFVQSDATNVIPEGLNENNNTASNATPISVILKPPVDLVVTNAVCPAVIQPNQTVTLNWQVFNQGASATNGPWTSSVYLAPTGNGQNGTLLTAKTYAPVLLPDGSANFSANVTIPALTDNVTWYWVIEADTDNSVFEYVFENNNQYITPVSARVPDLSPGTPTVPALVSGQTKTVTVPVSNNGQGALFNYTLTCDLYLDVSGTFNPATAIRIGAGEQILPLLTAGSTTGYTVAVQIPDSLSGAYLLYAVLDENNLIPESDDNNNRVSSAVSITLAEYPNLIAENVTVLPAANAGDTLTVSYQIRNVGSGPLSGRSWQDRLYLSPAPVFNADDGRLLGSLNRGGISIAANGIFSATTSVILPENTVAGDYYIVVMTDADNAIYEFNQENDNQAASALLLVDAYPNTDLEVTGASVDKAALESGQTLSVNWTVLNTAPSPTPAAFFSEDAVFLSVDNVLNPGDIRIGTFKRTDRIPADTSINQSLTLVTPAGLSGLFYVLVSADFNQAAYDDNRANNVRAAEVPGGAQPPRVNFSLPPLVDLVITDFEPPLEGTAGQPIQVLYRVRNNGPAATVAVRWVDALYLSQDPLISFNDAKLTSREFMGTLAPLASYDTTLTVFLPLNVSGNYQLLLRTDDTQQQYEHLADNNNVSGRSILINTALPCDLLPGAVSAPPTAVVGDSINVSWQLHNTGANPAKGYVREAVYWSKDTLWDAADVLAGILTTQNLNLAPGTSVSRTLGISLEGLIPENWYAIVRADVQNNFQESDESNNSRSAGAPTAVDMPELVFNMVEPLASRPLRQSYFKLVVPGNLQGETVRISLDGPESNTAGNALYANLGALPSLASAQFGADVPFSPDQILYIPSADSGIYYILVRDNRAQGDVQNLTLLAQALPFQILSVDASKGGNTGNVTVRLQGSKFSPDMSVALYSATLGNKNAEKVYYVNPTTAFATFNLKGAALGIYDVVGSKPGPQTTTLPAAFEIVAGTPPSNGSGDAASVVCSVSFSDGEDDLAVLLNTPPAVRQQRAFVISVSYQNATNIDLPAQKRLFLLKEGAGWLSYDAQELLLEGGTISLPLDLMERNGPPDIIRPGAGGLISFYAIVERGVRLLDYFLTE